MNGADDATNLIVHRGEKVFVIVNAFPYNNGHLMIVPYRHVPDPRSLDHDELLDWMTTTQLALAALDDAYGPDGYNLGVNLGCAAGAGIADHVHLHIVPRWNGDTNFMPVLAETKVISQHILDTYDQLRPHFV